MEKIELLERIEMQSGYIDMVDAFRLISIFTDEFGVVYTNLKPEDELKWMLLKLKGYNISSVKFEFGEKKCTKCGEVKSADSFSMNKATKDGRNSSCRLCCSKTGRLKNLAANEIEKGLLKICKKCKIEKRHFEFKSYYTLGKKHRKPNCLQCEAEITMLIENRKK